MRWFWSGSRIFALSIIVLLSSDFSRNSTKAYVVTQKPTGTGISAALMLAKFDPFPPNNSYSVGKASLKNKVYFLLFWLNI